MLLIVVKIGGKILENGLPPNVALDTKHITSTNKLIFIHGGGIEVTDIATRLGKPQRFIVSPSGFRSRYTDKETAEIYTMVMAGKLNKQAVIIFQRYGVPAIGLSGLDGHLIRAKRKKRLVIIDERGRKMAINGGYTGTVTGINLHLLHLLMDGGYVPVISPIAMSEKFEPLNIDGDRVAAYIAGSLKADMLVLLTDVNGIIINDKVVQTFSVSEAKEALSQIGHGMITKVHAAVEALGLGAKEVIISSGMVENPVSLAFTHQVGTVIIHE